jgi:hypothetical protein
MIIKNHYSKDPQDSKYIIKALLLLINRDEKNVVGFKHPSG